jgi:transcriptional regulator GlxA family with amidase domain
MQTQARLLFETSLDLLKCSNSLAAAIDYMKNNLTGKIDLTKAADIACMSRSGFFRKFKEVMGETPSQHILTQRLKLAQNLLRNTRKSVSEVCFASGFENLSHFSKAFKKAVGMTPKAWQISLS